MNLAELKARLEEIRSRWAEINTEAGADDAVLSEERQTEWDALQVEWDAKKAQITQIEARMATLRAQATQEPTTQVRGADPGPRDPATPTRTAPSFQRVRDAAEIYDYDTVVRGASSDSDRSARLRDAALRAVDGARLTHIRQLQGATHLKENAEDAQTRMSELLDTIDKPDEFAERLIRTGSDQYERAFWQAVRAGTPDVLDPEDRRVLLRAQALGTDSAGGYAVPFQLDPTVILTNAGTANPIRQVARIEQIVGKQWQGVTSSGASVTRGAEGSTAPDSSFTLTQPVVSTNRVQGFIPFSYEVDLAWGALRSEITKLLMDAKDREEDSFITGDGTGTNPGGLIGSASTATVAIDTTLGVGALSAQDVYNLYANLPVRWEQNASWLGNKGIFNIIRQYDTAGGAELWARIGDGTPARLLDYADKRVSAMANTAATGNNVLAFGDFKTAFIIVDRLGMNVELIPHVFDPSNSNRPTGQRGVYAIWMNNSKILVPQAYRVLQAS